MSKPNLRTAVRVALRRFALQCSREGGAELRKKIDRIEDETVKELEVELAKVEGGSDADANRID